MSVRCRKVGRSKSLLTTASAFIGSKYWRAIRARIASAWGADRIRLGAVPPASSLQSLGIRCGNQKNGIVNAVKQRLLLRNGGFQRDHGCVLPAPPGEKVPKDGRMDHGLQLCEGCRVREEQAGQPASVQRAVRLPERNPEPGFQRGKQIRIFPVQTLDRPVGIIDGDAPFLEICTDRGLSAADPTGHKQGFHRMLSTQSNTCGSMV